MWKKMEPIASFVGALIVIAAAMYTATQYFATQKELAKVECRARMLRDRLEARIDILEIEDKILAKNPRVNSLALREGAKPGSLKKNEKEEMERLSNELAKHQEEKSQKQQRREMLDKRLREDDVLNSSGECLAGKLP